MLVLRGAMTPATRREYAEVAGGLAAVARGRLAARRRVPLRAPRRALGDRRHRADHTPEGAARRATASPRPTSAAGSATCCASTSPSTSRTCRRRDAAPGRTPPPSRACCAATASTRSPASRSSCAPTTLAAPLLLAVQRELLEREAWPLLRVELPGQAEGWWAAARDAHLDGFAPAELAEAEGTDASLVIQAPENTRALAGVDPARHGPRRPRPPPGARGRPAPALVRHVLADRRRPPSRPAWARPSSPPSSAARRSSTTTTPSPPGRELSTRQARLIERLAPARARSTSRRRAPTCALRVDGRTWVNSDGRRNMPSRRGLHRARTRTSAEGRVRFTHPLEPARRGGRGRRARASARAAWSRRAPARARTTCSRRSTPTRARAGSASSASARTPASTGPVGAILFDEKIGGTVHLALGSLVSRDGRDQRVAPCTGT